MVAGTEALTEMKGHHDRDAENALTNALQGKEVGVLKTLYRAMTRNQNKDHKLTLVSRALFDTELRNLAKNQQKSRTQRAPSFQQRAGSLWPLRSQTMGAPPAG